MRKYRQPTFHSQITGWWDQNHSWHKGTPPNTRLGSMTGFIFYVQAPDGSWRDYHTVYWPPDSPLVGYTLDQIHTIMDYYNEFGSPDPETGDATEILET